MKKIIVFFIVLMVFAACKRPVHCDYEYGSILNTETNQCECIHSFDIDHQPPLEADGYNTCEQVMNHFNYNVLPSEVYPFLSENGVTVSFCGFLSDIPSYPFSNENESSDVYVFDMGDDSSAIREYHIGPLFIKISAAQLSQINRFNKVFAKGKLFFGSLPAEGNFPGFAIDYTTEIPHCSSPDLYFDIVEIRN